MFKPRTVVNTALRAGNRRASGWVARNAVMLRRAGLARCPERVGRPLTEGNRPSRAAPRPALDDPLLSFDPEISTPASRRSCVTVRAEPRAGAGEASHGLCPLDYSLAPRRSRKPPWRTYGPSFGSCKAALGRRAVARVWQCPNGTQANQEACLSPRPKRRRSCPGWLAMCVALHAVPEPRSHTCSSVPLRTRSPGPPQRRRRRRSAALV